MGKFFKEASASRRAVSEATKGMKSFLTKAKRLIRAGKERNKLDKVIDAGRAYEKLMITKKKLGAGKYLAKADKKVFNKLDKLEKIVTTEAKKSPKSKKLKDAKVTQKFLMDAIKKVGL